MKKGEHHALARSLKRCRRIVELVKTDGVNERENASFFARNCGVSPATAHRDIDFINANPGLFKGVLQWDAHTQNYRFAESADTARARNSEIEWLLERIGVAHPYVDDQTWKSVINALISGMGLQFDYHDIQELIHQPRVTLRAPKMLFDHGEWYLTDSEGKTAYNMRYIRGLRTF
jgi:hypothetical protein